jgi:hypothetical protein
MEPDEDLIGVVVHSGLVLGRSPGVVAAVRRITAVPAGLDLDVVVLAHGVHAEAAGRRERQASDHRAADAASQQKDEAAARQDREVAAKWGGEASAERQHARRQASIRRRYLPDLGEGDALRLGLLTTGGDPRWLDPYRSTRSGGADRYRLEASYWATPLPHDGLLEIVCGWPEIGLPETVTDVILPDLSARAAEARPLWELPPGP